MATLSGSINSSVTAIVASAATHGKKVGDYIAIDSEAMLIEGFGATALDAGAITPQWSTPEDKTKITVARAQLGTTAASHTSGATIASVNALYGSRSGSPIVAGGVIAAGATYAATSADDGKTILLSNSTASVVTLPPATGSGIRLRFVVSVIPSGTHKVQVTTTDIIQGGINTIDTDTAGTTTGFATAADSDTVSLNHGTQGAVTKGEWLELEDIAAATWAIRGQLSNTGNGATPFSAAVS